MPLLASHPREDYLRVANETVPSFHFRTGKPSLLQYEVAPKAPATEWGFPSPGQQSPTPAMATTTHYFVDDPTWNAIQDHGEFDDIVIGSGFCALAYVDKALELDPWRKILILERGGFWLSEHFQNMPLPFKLVLGGPSETFPWQLSSKTVNSTPKFVHGSCPFFGGRSTFWSAWSPRATGLMRNFPAAMLETSKTESFWEECEDLLHVTSANEIDSPVFGQHLQTLIYDRLKAAVGDKKIDTVDHFEHAPLAVGRKTSVAGSVAFDKFSTPGPLLALHEKQRHRAKDGKGHPLMIATDTIVERFETDPEDLLNRPNILHTSRGALCFPKGKTNLILAAGAFPNTTLLMNSAGDQLKDRAGSRVSGHFLTHVAARFPIANPAEEEKFMKHLEIGAHYLAGKDPHTQLQYHVQITAIHSPHPESDAEDAARLCPDYAAAATADQLKDSTHHIVLVCATLGELDEESTQSWFKHNPSNPDVTTNARLQMLLNEKAEFLWDIMDKVTYEAIGVMAADEAHNLEYWHDAIVTRKPGGWGHDYEITTVPQGWKKEKQPVDMIRVPGIVHETSTLYMSDDLEQDKHASVDSQYRPHGCNNVFVTGGALFPSSGSWNPTLTMCGFSQDLAKKLHEIKKSEMQQPQ